MKTNTSACDAWFHGEPGCTCPQGPPSNSDLIAWHLEQMELLRPMRRSRSHFEAAMMHAATVRALRSGGDER